MHCDLTSNNFREFQVVLSLRHSIIIQSFLTDVLRSGLFILPKGNWGGRRAGRMNNREKAFYRNHIKQDLSALNSIITKPRDAI